MKKILLFVLFSLWVCAFAQVPNAFKYQAVARDAAGDLIVNDTVAFQISLIQGGPSGTIVYTETHDTITNNYGVVNLEIGNGTVIAGDFTTIDWSLGDYFLQIEMDETGGTNYTLMGTSQLLSVPYAKYAESSGASDDGDWTVSGDNIYTNTEGNVGIGTSNPITDLEISDAGSYLYESAEIRISLFSDGDNSMPRMSFTHSRSPIQGDASSTQAVTLDGDNLGRFSFGGVRVNGSGGSSSGAGWFEMIQKGSTSEQGVPGQFQIITADGLGDRDTRFVVDPDGNVGIGTDNPLASLDIKGKLFLGASSGESPEGQIEFNNNSGNSERMIIRKNIGSNTFGEINVVSDHDLRFRTHDVDRLTIKNNGNIGIGTIDPSEMLDVEGNLDMNGNQIKNMVIENRTSDPSSPAVGQIWIRTDL